MAKNVKIEGAMPEFYQASTRPVETVSSFDDLKGVSESFSGFSVVFSTSLLLLNRKLSVSVFRLSFAPTKSLRMSTSSRAFVLAMESRPTSGSP